MIPPPCAKCPSKATWRTSSTLPNGLVILTPFCPTHAPKGALPAYRQASYMGAST